MAGRGMLTRIGSRLITLGELIRHFSGRHRFFLVPFLFVLLLAGLLLLATTGLGYVAPFVYTLF